MIAILEWSKTFCLKKLYVMLQMMATTTSYTISWEVTEHAKRVD